MLGLGSYIRAWHVLSAVALAALVALGSWGLPLPQPCFLPVGVIPPGKLPHHSKLEGAYAPNDLLMSATRILEGHVNGPESAVIAPDGAVWVFDRNGSVLRSAADGTGGFVTPPSQMVFIGGGRTLGAHFDNDGNLIFCHPPVGLMMLEKDSLRVVVLTSQVSGAASSVSGAIRYPNDLHIAPDGIIYFSDASAIGPALNALGFYDTLWAYILTQFQGEPTGRLLRYDPLTRETTVVADGIWFANGVALSPDGSFVAVVETAGMRVKRVWLTGQKAGHVDTLIDELPGYPDGISVGSDGNFWLAVLLPPLPSLNMVLPYPLARWLAAWVVNFKRPSPKPFGMVVQVSTEGKPLQVFMDPQGQTLSFISAVTEHAGRLYFGHLQNDYISYVELHKLGMSSKA